MNIEEFKKEVDKNIEKLFAKANKKEKQLINLMINIINDKCEKEQELIEYLKKEQERLAKETSAIYEDGLGKTKLVNEEIYNEVSKILSKIEKR